MGKVNVIMYHYVRKLHESQYPRIKGLDYHLFQEQILWLKKHFQFITVEDMMAVHEGDKKLPENAALLTFDDGYIDHYTNVFPILEQNGIQGFFSMPGKIIREKKVLDVNKIHFMLAGADIKEIKDKLFRRLDYYRGSEFDFPQNSELYNKLAIANRFDDKDTIFVKRALQVELPEKLRNLITDELFQEIVTDNESAFVEELYMNMEQIKTLQQHGMIFGFHGYEHYWMNRLSEKELRVDIGKALEVFDGIIDASKWICCYPYGSYSDGVIEVIKDMGAVMGFGTDVAVYRSGIDDIYKIPRLDTNDFPPKSENYLKIK